MQENTKRNILLCAAAKGSFWTRLSFFIMGTGCIRYKQYVRGLIYLLTQIGFFCFLKNCDCFWQGIAKIGNDDTVSE